MHIRRNVDRKTCPISRVYIVNHLKDATVLYYVNMEVVHVNRDKIPATSVWFPLNGKKVGRIGIFGKFSEVYIHLKSLVWLKSMFRATISASWTPTLSATW